MTTDDGARPSAPLGVTPPVDPQPPMADPPPAAPPAGDGTPPSGPPPTDPPRRPHGNGRPRETRKSFFRELPGIIITALVISVLIKTFLVQAFYIPSGSMENTLLVNDRVLVNKLTDKADEIHRGDVVVFRDPGGWLSSDEDTPDQTGLTGAIRKGLIFVGLAPAAGEEDLIKRVIGIGGDRVQSDGSHGVTVNGVPLKETYLFPTDLDVPSAEPFDVVVPKGELWVMGDHRSVSEDSRAHQGQPGGGFVPVKDVIGRAFTIVWPLDRAKILHRPDTFAQPRLQTGAH